MDPSQLHNNNHNNSNGAGLVGDEGGGAENELNNEAAMSSLDHALLESIFYNEMMLMDDANDDKASLISGSLLSTLSADGSVREPLQLQQQQQELVEDEMENVALDQKTNPLQNAVAETTMVVQPGAMNSMYTARVPVSVTTTTGQEKTIIQSSGAMEASSQVSAAISSQQLPVHTRVGSLGTLTASMVSNHTTTTNLQSSTTALTTTADATTATNLQVTPVPTAMTGDITGYSAVAPSYRAPTTTTHVEGEKRQHLVSQFASLASRLGITLPEPVVESLTNQERLKSQMHTSRYPGAPGNLSAAAGSNNVEPALGSLPNETRLQGQVESIRRPAIPISNDVIHRSATATSGPAGLPVAASIPQPPQPTLPAARTASILPSNPPVVVATPKFQQLAQAAEAAVVTASRKRDSPGGGFDYCEDSKNSSSPSNANPDGGTMSVNTAKQAPYSKRRKKPRLQDCESKLSELQGENAMLKRHLANLSSQSHAIDQERVLQEQRMRTMMEQGGSEDEMDDAVRHFTDMYSDYGRRRHQELSFHLDQLQRLANPTNFTKLGLWTMGQQSKNSRNPIAGILQKELGISAQQGKKILEQRKRIQTVCGNLKEVRYQTDSTVPQPKERTLLFSFLLFHWFSLFRFTRI